jgi:hypothetical protein
MEGAGMRGLVRCAVVRVAVVAAAGVLAAGMPAAAGAVGSAAAAGRALAAGRGGAVASGTWGTARKVPGTARLNVDRNAGVLSVSCAAAGDCSAGGYYRDGAAHQQAFVITQTNGRWGPAKEVPGTARLNVDGGAAVTTISCAAAGDCSAGGAYRDSVGHAQAFVVTQTNGIWGKAKEVPGTARLNAGGIAQTYSVSCAAAGDCSAGGVYRNRRGFYQAFVVTQTNGTWGPAREVPGTARLNTGAGAGLSSVSCAAPGDCSAGGDYTDSRGLSQAFVVTQTNGTWGPAKEVPGTARLNAGGSATVSSVSCAAAGDCSAGGTYDPSTGQQAFVVTQTNGTWGTAKEVPGTATLNTGGNAGVSSVSCATPGNCSAGGSYFNSSTGHQVFVVSEVNGIWGTAEEVPGIATLNVVRNAGVNSLSCATAGNCSAGGFYGAGGGLEAFVVTQAGGTWGTAEEVPGTASLNTGGDAAVNSLSCAAAGKCSAGGSYNGGGYQAFVVTER